MVICKVDLKVYKCRKESGTKGKLITDAFLINCYQLMDLAGN